jgi:hypothetical protein
MAIGVATYPASVARPLGGCQTGGRHTGVTRLTLGVEFAKPTACAHSVTTPARIIGPGSSCLYRQTVSSVPLPAPSCASVVR